MKTFGIALPAFAFLASAAMAQTVTYSEQIAPIIYNNCTICHRPGEVAPFPLMILTLLLVNIGNTEWMEKILAPTPESFRRTVKKIIRLVRSSPPGSLGVPFEGGK